MSKKTKKKPTHYAVARGLEVGIFKTWSEVARVTQGVSGSWYKGFQSKEEAEEWLKNEDVIVLSGELSTRQLEKRGHYVAAAVKGHSEDVEAAVKELSETLMKVQKEEQDATPIQTERKKKKKVDRKIKKKSINERKYENREKANLTKDQQTAMEVLLSGENCFVTGNAGTGKSYLLQEFVRQSEEAGKPVTVLAPTGVAAVNVEGKTIHSEMMMPLNVLEKEDYGILPELPDVIVIDEISMVRADLFNAVMNTIKLYEKELKVKIQVVLFGDFHQLPPVLTTEEKQYYSSIWGEQLFAFQTEVWKERNFRKIKLKEVVRQKEVELLENLDKIKVGDVSCIDWWNERVKNEKQEDAITVCGTNKTANKINNEGLAKLSGLAKVYKAKKEGDIKISETTAEYELKLKQGAKVIMIRNNGDLYQNGTIGIVLELKKDKILVRFGNNAVEVKRATWGNSRYEKTEEGWKETITGTVEQFPLKLAYAITIHKSQGKTFEKVNIIPEIFESGQLYVALSRCSTIEGINLMKTLKESHIEKINKEVLEFMKQE